MSQNGHALWRPSTLSDQPYMPKGEPLGLTAPGAQNGFGRYKWFAWNWETRMPSAERICCCRCVTRFTMVSSRYMSHRLIEALLVA